MGKLQGDRLAEGFQWQPEELGPRNSPGGVTQWTCCELMVTECRGVTATYPSEPKRRLRSTAAE